jgi:hypothetical protein
VRSGATPAPDEPSAIALGDPATSVAFPFFESVRATRGLAVSFSLEGLPGVLLYTIVNYARAWQVVRRVVEDLRDVVRQIREALRRLRRRFDDWDPPSLPEPVTVYSWLVVVLLVLIAIYVIIAIFTIGGAAGGTVGGGPGPGTAVGGAVGAAAGIAAVLVIAVLIKRMLDTQEREARDQLAAAGWEEPPPARSQARPPQGTPRAPGLVTMRTPVGACVIPPAAATQLIWNQAAAAMVLARSGAQAAAQELQSIAASMQSAAA